MSALQTKTIMCRLQDNVLYPDLNGNIPVQVEETLMPDNSKIGKVFFGGEMQGFLTYGICNDKAVAYQVSSYDPMGYKHRSFQNMMLMF